MVLILIFAVSPVVRGELATEAEMLQVCQNWLAQAVSEEGAWAGSDSPEIVATHEIRSGDRVLARSYDIAPRGYVVVPVLKELPMVMAYSDESDLNERQQGGMLSLLEEVLSHRLKLFADSYGDLNRSQPATGEVVFDRQQRLTWDMFSQPSQEFAARLKSAGYPALEEAGPLLTTDWNQWTPYNDHCPVGNGGRCPVGCTITATAQIMNYWEWPPRGIGSHSYHWNGDGDSGGDLSADFSDAYDWYHMPSGWRDAGNQGAAAAVADLCYEVGVAFEVNYAFAGSRAYIESAISAMPQFFRYRPIIQRLARYHFTPEAWFSQIQDEISSGRPILYAIWEHVIVCDGWKDRGYQQEYHMNYGWEDGHTNWYVLDKLDCNKPPPDTCPWQSEVMLTHIVPQTEPTISICGSTVDDHNGDADGHLDPGEMANLSLMLTNHGWDAGNVAFQIHSLDPFVQVIDSIISLNADLQTNQTEFSEMSIPIAVDSLCPDPHVARLSIVVVTSRGSFDLDTLQLFIGDSPGLSDSLPQNVDQWTHGSFKPWFVDDWYLDTLGNHAIWRMGGQDGGNYRDASDAALITQPFLLPRNARLSFWHWIDAEDSITLSLAWDGATVMISQGGCEWTQISPVDGYPYRIIRNVESPFAAETPCFSGRDSGRVAFDLSQYSGVVQIMFRFGSDGNITAKGWRIDSVEVVPAPFPGDANGDGAVSLSDIICLINYTLTSGNQSPIVKEAADVNGDNVVSILDAIGLIDYIFRKDP
jgi:hypothetical protein